MIGFLSRTRVSQVRDLKGDVIPHRDSPHSPQTLRQPKRGEIYLLATATVSNCALVANFAMPGAFSCTGFVPDMRCTCRCVANICLSCPANCYALSMYVFFHFTSLTRDQSSTARPINVGSTIRTRALCIRVYKHTMNRGKIVRNVKSFIPVVSIVINNVSVSFS